MVVMLEGHKRGRRQLVAGAQAGARATPHRGSASAASVCACSDDVNRFAFIVGIREACCVNRLHSVQLGAECDFVRNEVAFRYSTDGRSYAEIGQSHAMGRTPNAAHGIECSLFSCSTTAEAEGGHAEFDSFLMVTEFAGPADS